MSQATNSSDIRDTEQLEVQQKLDQLFRLLLLVSLPAALAAAARAIEFGFHAGAILQLACYVLLGMALLAGPRLGFRLRINIYTGLMVAFGGLGLYNYGLFGQGLITLVLACLLAAMVNRRFFRNVLVSSGIVALIVGFLFVGKLHILNFETNTLNSSIAAWLGAIATLALTWLALTTWSELRSSVDESRQRISSREADLAMILAAVEDGVIAVDQSMRVRYINPVACRLCECDQPGSIGQPLNEVLNIHSGNQMQISAHEIFRGTEGEGEFFLISRSGISVRIRLSVRGTGEESAEGIRFVLAFRDLTEEHRREQQLRHAEKMETLGRLTSGLVHDFNNHISVIQMSREMIEMKLERGVPLKDELNSIDLACQGAHQLAMQLRSFVRQDDSPGVQAHNLHDLVQLSQPLLRKAIPNKLQLEYGLWAQEDSVMVDRGQVQNALLNLVVNAADAIGEDGTIIISSLNRHIEQGECSSSRFDIRPGLYIRLSVSDNGSGIPEDIRAHIFEPFFTTKGSGKGSGLGLASVVDLMVLSEGQVSMETRLGQGTTFHLDFPLSALRSEAVAPEVAAPDGPQPDTGKMLDDRLEGNPGIGPLPQGS
ncbi:PAS domain-containing protein [bacterium]|nr:PAS domain-containing protein [bacterium]